MNNIPQLEPRREEPGFFTRLFMAPINFITSIFCDRGRGEVVDEPFIISKLPNYANDFNNYTNGMKRKLGILILYNENEMGYLRDFIEKILSLEFITEILVRMC